MAQLEEDHDQYPCSFNDDDGFVRGTAFIITMHHEQGANVERARIKDVLKVLRFEIMDCSYASASSLKQQIDNLAASEKHQSRDCFVCFINAINLKDGCISDDGGSSIYITADVIRPFMQSPALRNKPKVFFFLTASRGASWKTTSENTSSPASYNHDINRGDGLLVYCTDNGPSSWREYDEGSMYIKFLTYKLMMSHNEMHLVEILRNVDSAVFAELQKHKKSEDLPKDSKIDVIIESTLTKKLYWRTFIRERSSDHVSFAPVPGAEELIFIRFEELKFKEQIGEGSFGVVKRAVYQGVDVAAKKMSSVDHLKKEAIRVSPHAHVLGIFGYTRDAQEPAYWLVMEKMETDLHQLIESRSRSRNGSVEPFTLTQAVDVMLQIAEGMDHLHRNRVVHRDLKPRNVLVNVDDDGILLVKIADFGTSKPNFNTSDPKLHTYRQGTPAFMAPEMLGNGAEEGKYSSMVDVYSYGITCIQILTGKLPENGNILRSKEGNYPETLHYLVDTCCQKEPRAREDFSAICTSLQTLKRSGELVRKTPVYRVLRTERILHVPCLPMSCLRADELPRLRLHTLRLVDSSSLVHLILEGPELEIAAAKPAPK